MTISRGEDSLALGSESRAPTSIMSSVGKYNFAIDRGGTFTDVLCITPDGGIRTLKLLSEDPANYPDAPTEGIRRILAMETGNRARTADGLVNTELIGWVRMGTTVATNALLERAGDPVALVVNQGFRDLLQIGNQARPNIFQLVSMKLISTLGTMRLHRFKRVGSSTV